MDSFFFLKKMFLKDRRIIGLVMCIFFIVKSVLSFVFILDKVRNFYGIRFISNVGVLFSFYI